MGAIGVLDLQKSRSKIPMVRGSRMHENIAIQMTKIVKGEMQKNRVDIGFLCLQKTLKFCGKTTAFLRPRRVEIG